MCQRTTAWRVHVEVCNNPGPKRCSLEKFNRALPRRGYRDDFARHVERASTLVYHQLSLIADPPFQTHELLEISSDQVVPLRLVDLTVRCKGSLILHRSQ